MEVRKHTVMSEVGDAIERLLYTVNEEFVIGDDGYREELIEFHLDEGTDEFKNVGATPLSHLRKEQTSVSFPVEMTFNVPDTLRKLMARDFDAWLIMDLTTAVDFAEKHLHSETLEDALTKEQTHLMTIGSDEIDPLEFSFLGARLELRERGTDGDTFVITFDEYGRVRRTDWSTSLTRRVFGR